MMASMRQNGVDVMYRGALRLAAFWAPHFWVLRISALRFSMRLFLLNATESEARALRALR